MTDALWLLRGLEGVILVVGALIAYFSLVAYRRTNQGSLLALSVGFALISIAAALAGVIFELLGYDLLTAWIVASAFTSVGFLIILYSILRREAYPRPSPEMEPEAPPPPPST